MKHYLLHITILTSILLHGCNDIKPTSVSTAKPIKKDEKQIPLVNSIEELRANINKRIKLHATYYNPGKGCRYLDCTFQSIDIADYSFLAKDEKGCLTSVLKNGDTVEVEADLRFFAGSKSLVTKPPTLENMVQEASPQVKIIDGKEYYVYPPQFSIANGKLIRRIHDY